MRGDQITLVLCYPQAENKSVGKCEMRGIAMGIWEDGMIGALAGAVSSGDFAVSSLTAVLESICRLGGIDQIRFPEQEPLTWILSVCLYEYMAEKRGLQTEEDSFRCIHAAAGLDEASSRHEERALRQAMACGLYFCMIRAVIDGRGDLTERLQDGLDRGFEYYEQDLESAVETAEFANFRNLYALRDMPDPAMAAASPITSAVGALITTTTLPQALRKAAAFARRTGISTSCLSVAGGLAGLYYGCADIPEEWLQNVPRQRIRALCARAERLL